MVEGGLNGYLIAAIAAGAAALTVAAVRLRAWVRDLHEEVAPLPREFGAYFAAYVVMLWALQSLPEYWAYAVMVPAFTLAVAVTVHGPAPLLTRAFVHTVGVTLAVLAACLAIGAVLAPFLPE